MSNSTYELEESGFMSKVLPIVIVIGLMAIASRIAIPIPHTPVPLTLQVFVLISSSILLGARASGTAQAIYMLLILIGMPLTASHLSGPAAFVGPTAGYLLGFLPAAYLIGWFSEKAKKNIDLFYASMIGLLVIYLVGTAWLTAYMGSFNVAFTAGVLPFIGFDIAKAILAMATAKGLRGLGQTE